MKITLDLLENKNACREAREWFAKTHPKGCSMARAVATCPQGNWLIWGLWQSRTTTIEQIILAGCAAGRLSLRFSGPNLAVNTRAYEAAERVADDNTPKNRAAARDAGAAARNASWAAVWAAGAAGAAARDSEHKACADAIRALMRTPRWRRLGKGKVGR